MNRSGKRGRSGDPPERDDSVASADWSGRVALVTGASGGIGWATAELLAAQGMRVAITARREERLTELEERIRQGGPSFVAGGAVLAVPADLSQAAERERLVARVREAWGPIEVLVNNAGFGWGGPPETIPWETAQAMIEVNVNAVVHLCGLVLPEMLARHRGWIVNVASIAGDLPMPRIALYCATKTMVQSYSEALYRGMRTRGIHVAVVNPGPIATEFGVTAYGWSTERATEVGAPPEAAARAIWRAIVQRRKRVYIPGYYGPGRWANLVLEWAVDRGFDRVLSDVVHRLVPRRSKKPDEEAR